MFERYAVYFTPQGALAECGAAWLGWDVARGQAVPHPVIDGVDVAAVTSKPRKYGLHGTIKPPFVLERGHAPDELQHALGQLCAHIAPVQLDGLAIRKLANFLALTPLGDQTALAGIAAQIVTQLDKFRAPPTQAELDRRRQNPLTPAQEQHLANWGYPYVMDQFRFHITLTGRLTDNDSTHVLRAVTPYFAPHLPEPLVVDSLTLAGQGIDGQFREIHRYALTG